MENGCFLCFSDYPEYLLLNIMDSRGLMILNSKYLTVREERGEEKKKKSNSKMWLLNQSS
jgi:hypothetical protein